VAKHDPNPQGFVGPVDEGGFPADRADRKPRPPKDLYVDHGGSLIGWHEVGVRDPKGLHSMDPGVFHYVLADDNDPQSRGATTRADWRRRMISREVALRGLNYALGLPDKRHVVALIQSNRDPATATFTAVLVDDTRIEFGTVDRYLNRRHVQRLMLVGFHTVIAVEDDAEWEDYAAAAVSGAADLLNPFTPNETAPSGCTRSRP